ncbi:radical SAM protein [Spirillospora sp. NBC_01491]|uniref:radical SAM protein n=1 Tax=Spirillospora sp. NBC_01491 TaxID=2976007 RepID=UPI002E33D348|nr:radical SAM protein [Spirillospora sp. NBC_01491]
MTITTDIPAPTRIEPVAFLELEITRRCTAACLHCYSNSGPAGGTGTMTPADWTRVIEQAAAHPAIDTVQFIGGEPTLHPAFAELARFALGQFTRAVRADCGMSSTTSAPGGSETGRCPCTGPAPPSTRTA